MRRPEVLLGWIGAAGAVAAVYVVVVRGGGLLIGSSEKPHLGLTVLATAVVAFVVEPARGHCELWARRVLHEDRRSPYDVLASFSRQLTDDDGEEVTDRIARVLAEGTAARWAQVWLLVGDRLTLVASAPEDVPGLEDVPGAGDADRPGLRSVSVGHAGRLLGVLRVQEQENRSLSRVEERLFAGLAAQAGLVLHNARLQAELRVRHAQLLSRTVALRRSRDRIVLARQLERQRLERDLHDGAQQQLVMLGVNLRLAQRLAAARPGEAAAVLLGQADEADAAVTTLTELARGRRPLDLRERGLPDALSTVVSASPVPARLETSEVGRLGDRVEDAVYFCCVEALQNTAKHAAADSVDVSLRRTGEWAVLAVSDDGHGMPVHVEPGSGLRNMRSRAEALGGRVTVRSSSDGTTVEVRVPAAPVPAQRRG